MKSKNLEILKQNHINVPDFFVLKFEGLILNVVQLIEQTKNFEVQSETFDLECFSKKLQDLIEKNFVKNAVESVKDYFAGSLKTNGEALYSVRSSCNFEDGKEFSFAGVFESFLDVEESEFEEYILKCLQSLYSIKALEYVLLKKIDLSKLKMDVIIQKMVYGKCSGIGFSANPQGFLNEALITVGAGKGEEIVNDFIPTTTYYINIDDKKYFYDGVEDLLDVEEIRELLFVMQRIKEILGFKYVDIEFCVGERIHILQARPITSIEDEHIIILDNSNIVESYPGVSLPLTQSFAKLVYTGVFEGVGRRVLKNDALAFRYQDVYENMVGVANGSLYYQINNWYKLLQFLPFSRKIIPVWQEMLGVNNKSYGFEELNLPKLSKFKTYFSFLYEFLRVPKNMQKLNLEFQEVYAHFQEVFHNDLDNMQLTELFLEIKKRLIGIWDITLINDMYAFIFTGLLKSKLKKKYPEQYEKLSLDLISGISNIESMKPIRDLIELAHLKNKEGESKRYRENFQNYMELYADRSLEELKLESLTFRTNPELLEQKIEEYCGDPEKLELLRKNLHSQNSDKVGDFHTDKTESSNRIKEEVQIKNRDDDIDQNLKKHLESGFYAKRAMKGIENREISRLNRTRIFGMVRSIFLCIGKNFVKEGILQSERDIFYFEVDEVFEWIQKIEKAKNEDNARANNGEIKSDNIKSDATKTGSAKRDTTKADSLEQIQSLKEQMRHLVAKRKVEYALYEKLPTFHRVILNKNEIKRHFQYLNTAMHKDGSEADINDRDFQVEENLSKGGLKTLQGVPSSSGKVSAQVVVIDQPQLNLDVKDKIIVTKMTDPGWVFLLANAKGIIAEKGSLLSHTAIISRELKIPAVVGVCDATSFLKTGDTVLLDADEGRIEIMK